MTPAPSPKIESPGCDLKIPQEGRNEPQYANMRGYLIQKESSGFADPHRNLPPQPWHVPLLEQVGPKTWAASKKFALAKTEVVVEEQHLSHKSHGFYVGYLVVRDLKTSKPLIVDHRSFTPSRYWDCPPDQAIVHGPFIAL